MPPDGGRDVGDAIPYGSTLIRLSQDCAQLGGQGLQDLGGDTLGVGIGQGPVIGAEDQGEGNGLLALGNALAAVDVEQVDPAQELAAGGGDALGQLGDGGGLVTQQAQVAGDGGVLGQSGEGGLGSIMVNALLKSSSTQ